MERFKILLVVLVLPMVGIAQGYPVGERTLNYLDATRNRPVKAEIWYPTFDVDSLHLRRTELPFLLAPTIRDASFIDGKLPLVVLSHGTGGNRFSLAWLAIELAKNGYIVVSPDHWGNTFDNKIPEYFVRYWDRPLDITFLLDSILSDASVVSSIDSTRIGMVGFSFGGYTALAIAGVEIECGLIREMANTKTGKKEFTVPELGDLRKMIQDMECDKIPKKFVDERIKAVVAMAPALGLGMPERTQSTTAPILIIGVKEDRIAPMGTNALKYHQLLPNSTFIQLEGKTGHYIFLNPGNAELQKEAKRYYRDNQGVSRPSIHERVARDVLSFLQENVD